MQRPPRHCCSEKCILYMSVLISKKCLKVEVNFVSLILPDNPVYATLHN